MQATNIEQARREMVDFESKLNQRWKYEGGEWIKPEDAEKLPLKPLANGNEIKSAQGINGFVERWLKIKMGSQLVPETIRNYRSDLKVWVEEFEKREIKNIGSITKSIVYEIVSGWLQENAENLENLRKQKLEKEKLLSLNGSLVVSNLRMKRRLMVLAMVLDTAVDAGLISAVPFDSRATRKWFKNEKEPKQERKRLSESQFQKLISIARAMKSENGTPSYGPMLADLWSLMSKTGLRSAEARSIKWEHVDFQSGQIKLVYEKTKGKDPRSVPMISDLKKFLLGLKEKAEARGEGESTDYIFRGRNRTEPMSDLRDLVRKVAEKADMKNYFWDERRKYLRQSPSLGHHDFRRLFGSVLDENRMPRALIAKNMRHSDNGQMFDQAYAKTNDEIAKEWLKKVKFGFKLC